MNVHRIARWCVVGALVIFCSTMGLDKVLAAAPGQAGTEQGMQVLTRGPVHEAFAETVSFNPEPGIVVPKAPPEAIEELAPDQRPEGANVAWIPGYWAWDDERSDFLWVSGIWRALPPGRQWVPGYWGQTAQGAQWTSGYWADAQASEIQYLPEPPATVENGPNVAAPSADDNWLPGCWVWQQDRYAWRPGNWVAGQQDWQWVPAYYTWTPRGYVFVDGYWDYSVANRGVLFAPVYFGAGVTAQRGFSYSPSTVINPAVFASHLFLRPSYGHYYYGDYYDPSYANAGFSPWFSFQSSRFGYDPFFAQERWQNRQDPNWQQRTEANFRDFTNNANIRPPRTLAAQMALAASATAHNEKAFVVAAPLDELAKSKNNSLRLQRVDQAEQQQFSQHGQEYRQFLKQRQQLEANAANTTTAGPAKPAGPAKLPKSPYAAPAAGQLGKDNAPPKRYEVLKPDLTVEPQPRKPGGTQEVTPQGNKNVTTGVTKDQQKSAAKDQQKPATGGQQKGASGGQQQDASGGRQQGASGGQQQGASGGQQQGAAGGQQKGSSGGQQQGAPGGQQPRTAGGQEQGASPGQQKVNPQNQPADASTNKDRK